MINMKLKLMMKISQRKNPFISIKCQYKIYIHNVHSKKSINYPLRKLVSTQWPIKGPYELLL
uniref:Uncharacterized protein n=1 Tax=Anguilla anguilla TaxID=7936 RepID=A0A0E9VAL3_ANGAN